MRVTSVELRERLDQVVERARQGPVVVTVENRDHVVFISADEYAELRQSYRTVRLKSSLTDEEIEQIQKAEVPSKAE